MPINSQKKSNIDSSYFIGNFYAKLKIKGVEYLPQNLLSLNIRENIFDLVPMIELSILDNGMLSEKFPLEDGDEIEVELGSSDQVESVINMAFILQDFQIVNSDGDNLQVVVINLTGIMKNKDLMFPFKTRAFSNKTSMDVISTIASDCGFSPDVRIKTSDSMTWRQLQQNNYQMIFETLRRSFKSDDAVLSCITRTGDFVVTSLKSELKNKTTKKAIYDPHKAISNIGEKDTKAKTDEFYFNNFSINNSSGMVNKKIGYGVEYSYWDFENFTTKKLTSDFHGLTQFSFKNKENVGKIVKANQTGILNTLNVHKNYFEALAQNEFYISDFFKSCLVIYVNPDTKLNVFDKMNVIFPSFDDNEVVNSTLSGEYIVGSISYQVSKGGIFRCCLGLFRNGLNGSPFMKKAEYKVS